MNGAHFTPPIQRPGVSRGFTLIEMMIAMALGLVIVAASLAVYTTSSRGSQISQVETQLNEDGILALNLVQQQLKQAGYSSQVIPSGSSAVNVGNYRGVAVRGCDNGFADSGAAFDALACAAAGGGGSSSIAIRYQATPDNTIPTSAGNATNCIGDGINANTASDVNPAPTGGASVPAYARADNRYVVDASDSSSPMFSCRGADTSGIGSLQPLLANVESMHILYGIAANPSAELATAYDPLLHQIIGYKTAAEIDALPSSGTLLPSDSATLDKWGRVLSVRVCLVMRSNQRVQDAPDGAFSYKDCSNVDQTGTDGYLRKTYTTTVLLRNRLLTQ